MPKDHRRSERVAEAIRELAAIFLHDGVKDPRVVGLVTVTGVDVTQDLRHSKVFVSILGSDAERKNTMAGLDSSAGALRSRVAKSLSLRYAPEIEFKEDRSVERGARIDTLLAQIRDGVAPSDEDPID
ncbi:MAG: 30S ribosome-binding factor RbfA [Gemmatimonadaceae bacterium]